MGFSISHQPRFYAAPNFLKMGIKYLNFVVFWTISTIQDEKSAAKFHYIKTVSSKVGAQSIAFRVVSIYWQGIAPFPWYLNAKGPGPHWKHLRCTLGVIAWQPWRHCVTSLRSAHWLASSLKLAARCPVSGCWPSCFFQEDSAQVHCVPNTMQLSEICDFRVSAFCQVVQKHTFCEVA